MVHHRLTVLPLVLRRVRLERAVDVTARMRRITLVGEELGEFTREGLTLPAFASPGFDDHIKLIFASDGNVRDVLPAQLEHGIDWPPSRTRVTRDYTPRRHDPRARELDLDVVMHGDGPASAWARDAKPGDELWIVGPKSSVVVPQDADWVLLAGDETALPAISRFLEERPVDAPVRAVITIEDDAARQPLPAREGDVLDWVIAPAGDETALAEAVRAVQPPRGTPYVWAGAESRALLPVRRYVSREWGVPKSHVNITGYWHRDDEHTPEGAGTSTPKPVVSPVSWLAVRAAVLLGVPSVLADGELPVAELARRVGADPAGLEPLLAVLTTPGVVTTENDLVGLGPFGQELAVDEHARERFEGLHADQALALADLAPALRKGGAAWSHGTGTSLRQSIEDVPERYAELAEDAEGLVHLVTRVPSFAVWERGSRVAITGPGALVVAGVLAEGTGSSPAVVEEPGPLRVLRDEAGAASPFEFTETWGERDIAVTALALGHRTDAEAETLLRALRAAAPVAVLIEKLRPDGLSPAAAEEALLHVATLGTPPRGAADLDRIAARAGWMISARRPLGWGVECLELAATP
ncbi:siderophore-interacting protein [Saccharomonospora sp. NPDC006951]